MIAPREHRAMFKAQAKTLVRSQKGNAVVEFALILPMFLALFLGVVTFSTALYDKIILTMATRDGARAGAVYVSGISKDDRIAKARTAAKNFCSGKLISFSPGATLNVNPTISGADILTVTATYDYTGIDPFGLFKKVFTLSAETTMMVEVP
jgi:Flp pilus assembly protein TadG